jgi:DNA replication protein DnaD
VHEGYTLPDGKALTGGEKFPTMLRSIVSSTTLKMETHELKERRDKEENITGYIKELYKGCDLENIEKFADGTLSLTSTAKSRRSNFKFETELGSPISPLERERSRGASR